MKTLLLIGISACVLFTSTCSTAPAPKAEAAPVESDAQVKMTTSDLAPGWIQTPPQDEEYLYGIGFADSMEKAKSSSLINLGQSFSTHVTSSIETGSSGQNEDAINSINRQLTDYTLTGAKYCDQYKDPEGAYWILSRAPVNCLLDAAESILLSYRLELKQSPAEEKNIMEGVEKALQAGKLPYFTAPADIRNYLYLDNSLRKSLVYEIIDNGTAEAILSFITNSSGRREFTLTEADASSTFMLNGTENKSSAGQTVYRFGGNISGKGAFYSGLCMPEIFSEGDTWSRAWFSDLTADFSCHYLGAFKYNGRLYPDCYRLTVTAPDGDHPLWGGKGTYIIAPEIGLLQMEFERSDGSAVSMRLKL